MRLDRFGLTATLLVLGLSLWVGHLLAHSSGMTGRCDASNGCSCHGSANANGTVSVGITGPVSVAPGTTHSYSVSLTGGPSGSTGGLNLCASGGTLMAGFGTQVNSGQLTHTDSSSRFWTFQWTAPAGAGTVEFTMVGLAGNGSGSGGDSWNWYGGAAGTPFTITVDAAVPTLPTSWGRLKDRYR